MDGPNDRVVCSLPGVSTEHTEREHSTRWRSVDDRLAYIEHAGIARGAFSDLWSDSSRIAGRNRDAGPGHEAFHVRVTGHGNAKTRQTQSGFVIRDFVADLEGSAVSRGNYTFHSCRCYIRLRRSPTGYRSRLRCRSLRA
jgi:hypothetical protein